MREKSGQFEGKIRLAHPQQTRQTIRQPGNLGTGCSDEGVPSESSFNGSPPLPLVTVTVVLETWRLVNLYKIVSESTTWTVMDSQALKMRKLRQIMGCFQLSFPWLHSDTLPILPTCVEYQNLFLGTLPMPPLRAKPCWGQSISDMLSTGDGYLWTRNSLSFYIPVHPPSVIILWHGLDPGHWHTTIAVQQLL